MDLLCLRHRRWQTFNSFSCFIKSYYNEKITRTRSLRRNRVCKTTSRPPLTRTIMINFAFKSAHPASHRVRGVRSGSIIKYGHQPKKKIPSKCASKIDLLVVGQLKALWKVKVQGLTWRRFDRGPARLFLAVVFCGAEAKCVLHIDSLLFCERNRQLSPRLLPIYAPLTSPSASRCHLQTG